MQPAEGVRVWGLVLEVDPETRELIDRKEGQAGLYSPGDGPISVELSHEGRSVQAWVYQVTEAYICDEIIPPTRAYLDLIIGSAIRYNFPAEAVEALQATACRGQAG